MLLALSATAIVIVALLWEVALPRIRAGARAPPAPAARASPRRDYDPGRERRAEQRARQLLRSCVNDEEWAMYRDLGFIRVWGGLRGPAPRRHGATRDGAPYAYLSTRTSRSSPTCRRRGELLNEYCVEFPDETRPYGSARLPDSDDVLAKWMALTGDERRLIDEREHAPARAARSTPSRSAATSGA